jgi:hypothetical protein
MAMPTLFGLWHLGPTAALRVSAPASLHHMQRAFALGDTSAVRAAAESVRMERAARRGLGATDTEFLYHESLVMLAIGDTADAIRRLDAALEGLGVSRRLLDDVHRAAAIGSAMELRARLASRRGDVAGARRWARSVLALWSGADPELQPVVIALRPLANGSP